MPQCQYNPIHDMVSHHSGKQKLIRFPDGRRIDWRMVCGDCLRERQQWQDQRDIEEFQEKERKREWHKEIAERNRQHGLDRIARLEQELEMLKKKYF